MEGFIKGEIIVIPFPFSDLSASKRRPALVLADLPGEDIILCQITSKPISDGFAVSISPKDFAQGSLPNDSNIRPNRIFTASKSLIIRKVGLVNEDIITEVRNKIVSLLDQ